MCSLIRGNFTAKHNGPGKSNSKVEKFDVIKVNVQATENKFISGQCFYRPYIGIAHRDSSFDK